VLNYKTEQLQERGVNLVKKLEIKEIATRFKHLNMIAIVTILSVMVVTATFAMQGIAGDASMRLADIHLREALGHFNLHVNAELTLLEKAASCDSVRQWFANEGDSNKKEMAFDMLQQYASSMRSGEFYLGIKSSLNEYTMNVDMPLEYFVPHGRMVEGYYVDEWFFSVLSVDNDFLFNLTADKVAHRWRIWINYKVFYEGEVVGVLAAPVRIKEVLNSMFGSYNDNEVRGFMVDSEGYIHVGSTNLSHYSELVDELVHISSIDNALGNIVKDYVNSHEAPFDNYGENKIVRLAGELFGYAAVAGIANSDWLVVVLFEENVLFSQRQLMPLVVVLVITTIVYVVISQYMWSTLRNKAMTEQRLVSENEALQNLSRMRTEFLVTISHELKTPLYIMSGFAELALMELEESAEDTKDNLKTIMDESQRLSKLVDRLLEISTSVKSESVDVANAINRISALCEPILAKNKNKIDISVEDNCPNVLASYDMLIQVFVNLIGNANRHLREGVIKITAVKESEMVLFKVKDNGEGIDTDILESIFARGVSGGGSTGLGLAICKEAVEVYGGTISIESTLDEGTCVEFTLPIWTAEGDA